ncbi:MAG: hypothetical protein MUC35_00830 [Candidatus Margulisbacteria bacterium]|jgi:hypothetical protein|nr:hypothetical protein [Candidatus Margulisiibacteriota bacterium]
MKIPRILSDLKRLIMPGAQRPSQPPAFSAEFAATSIKRAAPEGKLNMDGIDALAVKTVAILTNYRRYGEETLGEMLGRIGKKLELDDSDLFRYYGRVDERAARAELAKSGRIAGRAFCGAGCDLTAYKAQADVLHHLLQGMLAVADLAESDPTKVGHFVNPLFRAIYGRDQSSLSSALKPLAQELYPAYEPVAYTAQFKELNLSYCAQLGKQQAFLTAAADRLWLNTDLLLCEVRLKLIMARERLD